MHSCRIDQERAFQQGTAALRWTCSSFQSQLEKADSSHKAGTSELELQEKKKKKIDISFMNKVLLLLHPHRLS